MGEVSLGGRHAGLKAETGDLFMKTNGVRNFGLRSAGKKFRIPSHFHHRPAFPTRPRSFV